MDLATITNACTRSISRWERNYSAARLIFKRLIREPAITVTAPMWSSILDNIRSAPRLLLLNGIIYTGWASHCDIRPYTGWIMGYSESTLAQTSVLNVTPNGNEGAIWMAGAGLAADSSGNIYFLDANGDFDTTLNPQGFPSDGDYGNAFMKLSTTGDATGSGRLFRDGQ